MEFSAASAGLVCRVGVHVLQCGGVWIGAGLRGPELGRSRSNRRFVARARRCGVSLVRLGDLVVASATRIRRQSEELPELKLFHAETDLLLAARARAHFPRGG